MNLHLTALSAARNAHALAKIKMKWLGTSDPSVHTDEGLNFVIDVSGQCIFVKLFIYLVLSFYLVLLSIHKRKFVTYLLLS